MTPADAIPDFDTPRTLAKGTPMPPDFAQRAAQIAALHTKPLQQARPQPQFPPLDTPAFLLQCAAALEGKNVTLLWHGNAKTGFYDGFDVIAPGRGVVASVRI